MSEELKSDTDQKATVTTVQVPRPLSPRKFFARLYGHLEEPSKPPPKSPYESESSSDVEVEENSTTEEHPRSPPLWPPPPLLPLCPRPMMLPYQQLAASPYYNYLARRRRKESRPRRQRTTFSAHQTLRLELEYARGEYVAKAKRCELASALSLSENQVKIWFQNRRAKDKRIEKAQMDQQYRQLAVSGLLPTVLGPPYCSTPPCPYIPLRPPTLDK